MTSVEHKLGPSSIENWPRSAEHAIFRTLTRKGTSKAGDGVDDTAQVIVASAVAQASNGKKQLVPVLKQVKATLGKMPEVVLADAGYFGTAAVTDAVFLQTDLCVCPDQQRHSEELPVSSDPVPGDAAVVEQMRYKLGTPQGRTAYRRRKVVVVELVFGQVKEVCGFRRFSLRGFDQVAAEWDLICMTHNLLTLFCSGWRPALAEG